MKTLVQKARAFAPVGLVCFSGGCFLVAHDSETRPPPPVDGSVIYWSVVDQGTGAELASGCAVPKARSSKILFKAPVGAHVVETVLYEYVEKTAGSVPNFSDNAAEDAFWCAKANDQRRYAYEFALDVNCMDPSGASPPATIVSREIIPGRVGGSMGGYRLGLEILGAGTLAYKEDPSCVLSRGNELTILPP